MGKGELCRWYSRTYWTKVLNGRPWEFSWCCSFLGGFGWSAAECSGSQAAAGSRLVAPLDSEVVAATPGGVGALLRGERLYSALLAYWRRERANGILEALTPRNVHQPPKPAAVPTEVWINKPLNSNETTH
jgi:hypothetical protein